MPAPGLGRQILFHLSHAAVFALLGFISSWLMGKIEDSLFEKDCKKLEPTIQAMLDQQKAKIDALVRTPGTLYANVRLAVVRNWVPNGDWQNPGGDWRYFTTDLLSVDVSKADIRSHDEVVLDPSNVMLVSRHPFTYSFPLGTPVPEPDMPAGFQAVLDYVATVLQEVQRTYSVGGPRFAELNAGVDGALRSLGKTWEPDWAEALSDSDAKRFGLVRAAVERALRGAHAVFGANPSPDERQVIAQLGVVALQLKALDDSWPRRLDDGTWRGSTP
jgi:hypothetical protein